MASNGAPTENVLKFVDFFLQPCVAGIPSFIQDTTEFINKLPSLPVLPSGSLLVTLDVFLLYTNVSHDEGIAACEGALNSRELLVSPTADICYIIRLNLWMNSFMFNQKHYLKIQGTAIAEAAAPLFHWGGEALT